MHVENDHVHGPEPHHHESGATEKSSHAHEDCVVAVAPEPPSLTLLAGVAIPDALDAPRGHDAAPPAWVGPSGQAQYLLAPKHSPPAPLHT